MREGTPGKWLTKSQPNEEDQESGGRPYAPTEINHSEAYPTSSEEIGKGKHTYVPAEQLERLRGILEKEE